MKVRLFLVQTTVFTFGEKTTKSTTPHLICSRSERKIGLIIWGCIPLTCDLPFVPAATKSKCMGQENKWNDQHCQNVFGVRTNSLKQYPTWIIRNNGLIEECFVALITLSFGQWDIFLSSFIGPLSPAISIREELWQWEIYFLSRLKLFCSLCTLAVYIMAAK